MSSNTFTAIVEKYFCRNGGWLRLKGELTVYYWQRIAGAELAKKVEAIRYRDGFLYLQTESPALAHQLLLMVPDVLEKYQKYLGKGVLKGIKVKVGSLKQQTVQAVYQERELLLGPEETAAIDRCKKEILDSELADKFGAFMQKNFLNQKNKKADSGKVCQSCGVAIDIAFNYCPCCERKVNEEIKAYLKYQKKVNPELNQDNPSEFAGLSHLQVKKGNLNTGR